MEMRDAAVQWLGAIGQPFNVERAVAPDGYTLLQVSVVNPGMRLSTTI
jgi:hypothetical protein